jgi:hypothetical protein
VTDGERRNVLDEIARDSAEIVRLIAAELWDDAVSIARTRATKLSRLFADPLAADQRREMAPLLHEVVRNDESLIRGLERRRAACFSALQSMQQGREAAAAYGRVI